MLLLADIPTVLNQADQVAQGLEAGPIRYVAALSLVCNLVLLSWIARQYVVRVRELKEEVREVTVLAYKLEGAVVLLDKAMSALPPPRRRDKPGDSSPPVKALP